MFPGRKIASLRILRPGISQKSPQNPERAAVAGELAFPSTGIYLPDTFSWYSASSSFWSSTVATPVQGQPREA